MSIYFKLALTALVVFGVNFSVMILCCGISVTAFKGQETPLLDRIARWTCGIWMGSVVVGMLAVICGILTAIWR